jgi:hypothetical protein
MGFIHLILLLEIARGKTENKVPTTERNLLTPRVKFIEIADRKKGWD